MSDVDMNQVIEDSVNDAQIEETPEPEVSDEVVTPDAEVEAPADDAVPEVQAIVKPGNEPVAEPATPAEDAFAKKFGIPAKSVTGRENRIPYSRVKKIIEKNEAETVARVTKELETKYQTQLGELSPKLKDYEEKLGKVAKFEDILENDPKTFLEHLSQFPAYKPFFDYVNKLAAPPESQASTTPQAVDPDVRPLPNKKLADGSMVYDLEGLDALMAWQARQVEKKVTADLEEKVTKRYEPIEKEWQHREYMTKIAPQIDKQIADARTWPHFTENEAEIVKILQADKQISLDGAYRQVMTNIVLPKLAADKTKMRTEVLAELKAKPVSSGSPAARTVPAPASGGKMSLEEIIAAEIAKVQG